VCPVSPLPIYPSSTTATLLPSFESIYAVDRPAMPPPTIATSTEMSLFSLLNLSDSIIPVQVSQRRSSGCFRLLYVADDDNCRVQKFDSNGNFISEWGRKGSDKGEFKFPKGVAVDASGYVYVTDDENHLMIPSISRLAPIVKGNRFFKNFSGFKMEKNQIIEKEIFQNVSKG